MNHPIGNATSIASRASSQWRARLKHAIRDSQTLLELLQLSSIDDPNRNRTIDELSNVNNKQDNDRFPLLVTREYASRMKVGDWHDPLFRQVWIDAPQRIAHYDFVADPVGDQDVEIAPGLLQKYAGRVLLVATGACAIHCRYCFRRHYPYSDAPKSLDDWQPALARIASDRSINEVILSGGDPLMNVDSTLARLVSQIEAIEHVERLRVHTRLPIVLPQRVNDEMLRWFRASRLSKWVVLHVNHAQEIDADVEAAVASLQSAGATILNQAVLLRAINDSVEVQEALCKRLLRMSVLPYYLHQLDRVDGAAHFETDIELGKSIVRELAKRLPGYGVPRFVSEQPGQPNKTRLA